jgi:O-antigen/teichoic acid export membrane protein
MPVGPAAFVAVATMLGNAVAYLFAVATSHQLRPDDYGALVSLLTVVIAVAGPGLALQAVVARRVAICAREGLSTRQVRRRANRMGLRLGLAVTVPLTTGAPLIADYLHLGSPTPVIWLTAGLAPMPLLFAACGLLQGGERFGPLGVVLLVSAAGKVPLGLALVAFGLGVNGALAGIAAGTLAATLLAAGTSSALDPPTRQPLRPGRVISLGLPRELASATVGILGLLVLTNLDVLLARHYLGSDASGLYAAGSMIAKVAYWAPLAVVVTVFPRIAVSEPARRMSLLRGAALATLGFGTLCAAGGVLIARWPSLLPFGADYRGVGADLPLFATLGTAFALANLLLFADIATGGRRTGTLVGGAVGGEALLIAVRFHHSVTQIATVALLCAAGLLVAGGLPQLTARRLPDAAVPDHPPTTKERLGQPAET